jgi:hypothetical protein
MQKNAMMQHKKYKNTQNNAMMRQKNTKKCKKMQQRITK